MSRNPFGWDLPPGVTTSMLPGNSREEQEEEAFSEAVYEMLGEGVSEELADKVYQWASKMRSDAYAAGYQEGMSDEKMAQEMAEAKESEMEYREDEDYDFEPDYDDPRMEFADPGGRSALRAATKDNPRNLPCPNCGAENRLTPADRARGYQCDACADKLERGGE